MDTDLLLTFIQVAKTGGFRAATEQLYVTQSAVSARIRLLEEQIGARLFERDRHGARLTVAGTRLMQHAERILSEWQRCCQEVVLPADTTALISVGTADSLWTLFLRPWVSHIRKEVRDLAVHAEIAPAENLIPRLLDGSYDLVLAFESAQLPQVVSVELTVLDMVLVSSSRKTTVTGAMDDRYVFINWSPEFSAIHDQLFRDECPSRVQTSMGRVALDLLLDGGGASYLPLPLVQPYLNKRSLFRVKDAPRIPRPVHAIHLASRQEDAVVELAIKTLGETVHAV